MFVQVAVAMMIMMTMLPGKEVGGCLHFFHSTDCHRHFLIMLLWNQTNSYWNNHFLIVLGDLTMYLEGLGKGSGVAYIFITPPTYH